MQTSVGSQDKIALFAFRKSQKVFFDKILHHCYDQNIELISSKNSFLLSLKALRHLKNKHLKDACDFAIDEFYAKTKFQIPKILLVGYFKFFSIINFLRYYAALDDGYTKMLIWNGGKFRQIIAIEVARLKRIKVYFFENGLLPHTIVFDENGINYNNSVPRNKSFFQHYKTDVVLPTSLVPRVGKDRDIFKGKKATLPEKYIFIPFQVDYDTQIISHSHWIKNMRILFNLIENVSKYSTYHFIMKEHPSSSVEYLDLHERVERIKNVSFKNSHTTQELIENSLAVLTINSTVGIESLLFHKKVIVLGDAFYKIDGITYGVQDEKELISMIDKIEQLELDEALVDNFLKYLYNDYLVPKNDEMYNIFCQKMLKNKLTISVKG